MSQAQRSMPLETPTLPTVQRLATVVAGVALAVFLIAPRSSPVLLLAMAAPAVTLAVPADVRLADLGRLPIVAALAFALYLLANSLWALDPMDALGKSLLFIAIVTALWLTRHGLTRLPQPCLEQLTRVAAIAFTVALCYLLVEEVTSHQIKRALFNWLPFTRPSDKHIQLDGEVVTNIYLYASNRSMAAVTLALWPLLLVLARPGARLDRTASQVLAGFAVLAVAAVTIGMSYHETSAIALVLSAAAAALAFWSPRLATTMVAVAWVVSTLLVVPIASQAYTQKMHMAEWLPDTARHRIIIWGYTAEQIPNAPILGIGIGSGKILDARHKYETPPGHLYPRRAGTHSHNIYVQAWYELGAIGAVLLCALGLALLAAIGRLERQLQSSALATFVAGAAIAAFSWGMWQPWFMAAFGIAAVWFLIAAERARRDLAAGAGSAGGS